MSTIVPETMTAVLLSGDRTAHLAEVELPQVCSEDAVVQVTVSAVCGSDLPHYRKAPTELGGRLTTVPGHEAVGIVRRQSRHGGPREGTRVIVYQHSGDGTCEHCLRGEPMFCEQRQTLGNHRHGADAPWIVAPASSLIPLPDDIDDALAALVACNFGTAFMGFSKTSAKPGDRVVVVGLGPVGACVVAAASAAGCHVIAIDPIAGRRKLVERMGATTVIDPTEVDPVESVREVTEGGGAEIVVECSANPHAQQQAMKSARVHGTVLLLGANNAMEIDPGIDVIRRELRIFGSWVFKPYEVSTVLRAARALPQLRLLLGEPFPAERAPDAFAAADAGHIGKVLIDWSQADQR